MKLLYIIILTTTIGILSGCSTLNPYGKESDCPDPYNGECVSMDTAYRKSKADPKNSVRPRIDPKHDSPLIKDRDKKYGETAPIDRQRSVYKKELYREIAGLVEQPVTPVRIPAKYLRVLVLGYDREDLFYSHRFIFFQSDKSRWILDVMED